VLTVLLLWLIGGVLDRTPHLTLLLLLVVLVLGVDQ
jgi:hypothetical protein